MLDNKEIDEICATSIKEVLEKPERFNLNSYFIGPDSLIESIDIVQIISFIEDKLEDKGYEGYDFLEKIFEYSSLTFSDLSNLIYKEINQENVHNQR